MARYDWEDRERRSQEAEEKRAERERLAQDRQQKQSLAAQLTREAELTIAEVETILQATFQNHYPDVWESMIDRRPFPKPRPKPPEKLGLPEKPDPSSFPPRPQPADAEFQPRYGLLDKIIPGRTQSRIDEAKRRYESDLAEWKEMAREFNIEVEQYNDLLKVRKEMSEWPGQSAACPGGEGVGSGARCALPPRRLRTLLF